MTTTTPAAPPPRKEKDRDLVIGETYEFELRGRLHSGRLVGIHPQVSDGKCCDFQVRLGNGQVYRHQVPVDAVFRTREEALACCRRNRVYWETRLAMLTVD